MDFYDYWILKTNVSYKIKTALIKEFGTSKNVFEQLIGNGNLSYINLNECDKFKTTYEFLKNNFDIDDYNLKLEKNNIKFVRFDDEIFPEKLKNIDDIPFGLFYRGNLSLANEYCISVIGTRNSTPYGEEVCKRISKEICMNEVGIVSGGARSIDILSHKICLENQGKPICVLGSGILNYYPKENSIYFDEIGKSGCLISEYDLYAKPDRFNFPERNRIIAALGNGLIVVEAKEKSGTMITVKYALDYGKDIAAIPGPIFWQTSLGCNKIIKDGAFIISEINDIYEIFKLKGNKSKTNSSIYKKLFEDPVKFKVFSMIKNKPCNVDEIANESNIPITQLYKTLFELEYLNLIESSSGNFYQIKSM